MIDAVRLIVRGHPPSSGGWRDVGPFSPFHHLYP